MRFYVNWSFLRIFWIFFFVGMFEYWMVLWKQVSFKYCSLTLAALRGSYIYFLSTNNVTFPPSVDVRTKFGPNRSTDIRRLCIKADMILAMISNSRSVLDFKQYSEILILGIPRENRSQNVRFWPGSKHIYHSYELGRSYRSVSGFNKYMKSR